MQRRTRIQRQRSKVKIYIYIYIYYICIYCIDLVPDEAALVQDRVLIPRAFLEAEAETEDTKRNLVEAEGN